MSKSLLIVGMVLLATGANGEERSDGVFPRSATTVYRVRAGVIDYTTLGNPGALGSITITRGNAFRFSRPVQGNSPDSTYAFVGVRTPVPGRVYRVTCNYRGLQATRYVEATARRFEFNFKYSEDSFGRGYLVW